MQKKVEVIKLEIIVILLEKQRSCSLYFQSKIQTYDYHFIIKELSENVKGQFRCLGENTEKYITFSVPIKKGNSKRYKIRFIDSSRFMSNLLSSLVDNLSDKLYSDKCRDCKSYPRYMLIKDIQLIFRCFECKYIYIYIYIYI